jgi:type II secretory pathway pseudopilin PulG
MVPAAVFQIKGITIIELIIALTLVMILSSAVFISLRQTQRRTLENATLQVQADLRYAQRRATMEGRTFGITFTSRNSYRIFFADPVRRDVSADIFLPSGASFDFNLPQSITFTPRGTAGNTFTIRIRTGSQLLQRITVTVGGARVYAHPVERIP